MAEETTKKPRSLHTPPRHHELSEHGTMDTKEKQ